MTLRAGTNMEGNSVDEVDLMFCWVSMPKASIWAEIFCHSPGLCKISEFLMYYPSSPLSAMSSVYSLRGMGLV